MFAEPRNVYCADRTFQKDAITIVPITSVMRALSDFSIRPITGALARVLLLHLTRLREYNAPSIKKENICSQAHCANDGRRSHRVSLRFITSYIRHAHYASLCYMLRCVLAVIATYCRRNEIFCGFEER